jgi:hypothetical protein
MRLFFLCLLLLLATSTSAANKVLKLSELIGNWQGAGEMVLPGVDISMELTGEALIGYDSAGDFYRTAITAEKFLFVYSDSGHLFSDGSDTGIVWELWNSFGQHLRLSGVIDEQAMRGSQRFGSKTYHLELKQITADSLSAVITQSRKSATNRVVGQFGLRRVKP